MFLSAFRGRRVTDEKASQMAVLVVKSLLTEFPCKRTMQELLYSAANRTRARWFVGDPV